MHHNFEISHFLLKCVPANNLLLFFSALAQKIFCCIFSTYIFMYVCKYTLGLDNIGCFQA